MRGWDVRLWCFSLLFSVLLVPALCLAQTSATLSNQNVIEELKGIRASLERLEKGQKALLALTRMEMDESRLAALEQKRMRLSVQEEELNKQATAAAAANSAQIAVAETDGPVAQPSLPRDDSAARARFDQVSRTLREVSRERELMDQEIARLKERINALEKRFEEAMR